MPAAPLGGVRLPVHLDRRGPFEPRNVSRAFDELTAGHGVRRVRLHDLRHTCVSLLLSLGVHPRVVMEIVGHSTIEMTMNVYGHMLSPREARGAHPR